MANEAEARYGPVTRLRMRLPGTIDPPHETSPLPVPTGDWERLVLDLPETKQPALREPLQRLLATDRAWTNDKHWIGPRHAPRSGRDNRWMIGPHAPRAWFTAHIAQMQDEEESATDWDLHLKPLATAPALLNQSNAQPLEEVVPKATLDESDQPVPYSGCRAIIIHRDHLERLCGLAQQTLVGRLRTGWRRLAGRRQRQRPRTVAREIAQTQLAALADIHEQLAAAQTDHISVQPLEALFCSRE